MVGHLFQNYDTIYVQFFPTYTCNHSCYTIYVRFFATYICVLSCFVGFLFPSIWPFSYKCACICAQKKPIYMRYKQAYGIWGHRKSSYKRHQINTVCKKTLHVRWSRKVTSVWICNGRVNFEQGLVLIHCPHTSGGCWLSDNGFFGSLGLSFERLCTLFHKCWPKQRSIQLEINVRQAKHDLQARDNVKHDLESLLEQIGFSSFLSLARIITFSPPRTSSKPPSLEAFYSFPPFTL